MGKGDVGLEHIVRFGKRLWPDAREIAVGIGAGLRQRLCPGGDVADDRLDIALDRHAFQPGDGIGVAERRDQRQPLVHMGEGGGILALDLVHRPQLDQAYARQRMGEVAYAHLHRLVVQRGPGVARLLRHRLGEIVIFEQGRRFFIERAQLGVARIVDAKARHGLGNARQHRHRRQRQHHGYPACQKPHRLSPDSAPTASFAGAGALASSYKRSGRTIMPGSGASPSAADRHP